MSAAVELKKRLVKVEVTLWDSVRLNVPTLYTRIILPSTWVPPVGGAMPVRLDAAVQFSRWNAEEPVMTRSLVLAAMSVVVEGKAKEPPAIVDCPSRT